MASIADHARKLVELGVSPEDVDAKVAEGSPEIIPPETVFPEEEDRPTGVQMAQVEQEAFADEYRDYFDESGVEYTDYLGEDDTSPNYMNPKTSKELATAKALAEEGFSPALPQRVQELDAEHQVTGVLDTEEITEENLSATKGAFYEMEGDAQENLVSVKETQDLQKMQPGVLTVLQEAVDEIGPERAQKLIPFFSVAEDAVKRRHIHDMFEAASSEELKNSGFIEIAGDLVEAVVDSLGVSDRVQRREIALASGQDIDVVNFLRSSDIEQAMEGFDDLPFERQVELAQTIIEASRTAEGALGNHNMFFSSEFNRELADAVVGEYGANDWITLFDAIGLAALPSTLNALRRGLKAMAVKTIKMRDRALGLDISDDIADAERIIDEALAELSPNQDKENVLTVYKGLSSPDKDESGLRYTSVRMGNSSLGNVSNSIAPQTLRSFLETSRKEGTLEESMAALGMAPEDALAAAAARVDGEATDGISPFVFIQEGAETPITDLVRGDSAAYLYANKPLSQVIREDEIIVKSQTQLERIRELSGKTLTLHPHSSTIKVQGENLEILGRFGNGETDGFSSFDEAISAATKVAGENFEVQIRVPNTGEFRTVTGDIGSPAEYFIKFKLERPLDSRDAYKYLDGSARWEGGVINRLLMTNVDRIGSSSVDDFSSLHSWDRAVVKRFQKMLKPYTRLKKKQRDTVNALLEYGDANEVSFTIRSARDQFPEMNLRENSKVWKAYLAVRRYYDELADINDMRLRAKYEKAGLKSSGIVDESNRTYFGKPLTYDEARASDGAKILNVETDEVLDLKNLEDLEGFTPMRLQRAIETPEGDFNLILRKTDSVKPLPREILPRRDGYINLDYERVKYLITVNKPRVLNGVPKEKGSQSVVYFANSVADANKFLDSKPKGSSKTNRELLEEKNEGVVGIEESREEKFDLGILDINPDGTAIPSHFKQRGESPVETVPPSGLASAITLAVRGGAEVMAMEGRLATSLQKLENTLQRDSIDVFKSRFMGTYGKHLKDRESFPTGRTLDGQFSTTDLKTRKDMEAQYQYIRGLENMLGGRADSLGIAEAEALVASLGFNPLSLAGKTATVVYIYWRATYQFVANLSQVLTLTQLDPVRGTASTVEAIMSIPAIAARRGGINLDSNVYAKIVGFKDAAEMNKFLDSIEVSGVLEASQIDNLLSRFDDARKMAHKNMFRSLGQKFVDLPRDFQASAIDLSRLAAYRHAYKRVQDEGIDPVSKKGLLRTKKVLNELTFRMDKTDFLASETNKSAFALMWTQHVYKGFKDTVLQPAMRTATIPASRLTGIGKDGLFKENSIWAKDWKQSVTSTAMNLAMFGTAGVIGSEASLALDEYLREKGLLQEDEKVPEILMEGLIDAGVKEGLGVDINIAERISFGDSISMMYSMSGMDEQVINFLGGGALLGTKIGRLFESYSMAWDLHALDETDLIETLDFIIDETARAVPSFSDFERALIVKNLGIYTSNSGMPLYKVDPEAALGVAFSFNPDEVSVRNRILFEGTGTQKEEDFYRKTLPRTMARAFWNELLDVQEGESDFDRYKRALDKWTKRTGALAGDRGGNEKAFEAKRAFQRLTIDPSSEVFTEAHFLEKAKNFVQNLDVGKSYIESKARYEHLINQTDDEQMRDLLETNLKVLQFKEEILGDDNG